MRIVAKALEDFNGDWHWVDLHNAELIDAEQRIYKIDGADTLCGIRLSGPNTTRLHDTGAPPEPDCALCQRDAGPSAGLMAQVDAVVEEAERVPEPVAPST